MLSENVIREMLKSHESNEPNERALNNLVKDNPGTTKEYWKGYFFCVSDGYKIVLEEK